MRGKRANDDGFELLKLLARHGRLFDFQFGGEQAAQRVALVDGKRGNDTARVRNRFEPLSFAPRQRHFNPPLWTCYGRTEAAEPRKPLTSSGYAISTLR